MKKTFLLSIIVCGLILGCAGKSPHVRFAYDLRSGLDTAKSSGKATIIEFTSPT